MVKFTIEADEVDLLFFAQTLLDGLASAASNAAEDGLPFDMYDTLEWRVYQQIQAEYGPED